MKQNYDITSIRGDTYELLLNFTLADGTPYDLSDFALVFTLKRGGTDTQHLLQKTLTKVDVVNGIAQLAIAASDRDDIKAGTYNYDIQMQNDDGIIITIAYGSYLLIQDVNN